MIVMREKGQLEVPNIKDIEERAVQLFTKMAECDAPKEAEAREEEQLGRKLGVGRLEPVFLDYLHS